MSTRDERDYDRGEWGYGRRSEPDYDRSYGERYQRRYGYGRDESERERYAGESRTGGDYGSGRYGAREYGGRSYYSSGSPYRARGEYRGREAFRPGSESDWDYIDERESRYGSFSRGYDTGSYDDPGRYDDRSRRYSPRYQYPTGFRSTEMYPERGRGHEYGEYGSGHYPQERGWWDRASDEVASWFGDEEAERRRRMDEQRRWFRGKGPKGYQRSDERIKEDVNDRLSEGYLDASEIEVSVKDCEVTLNGTVNTRTDKRRAEYIVEDVMGVTNVENRLRVQRSDTGYPTMRTTSTPETTGTTTATARGKTAGT